MSKSRLAENWLEGLADSSTNGYNKNNFVSKHSLDCQQDSNRHVFIKRKLRILESNLILSSPEFTETNFPGNGRKLYR